MTSHLQQSYFIDPWQLENKLGEILVTLQYQNQQYKKHYLGKIQHLTSQMQKKDQQLEQMRKNLQEIQRKYQELQWKVIEKDNIIEDYQNKYKNVQDVVLDKVRRAIDSIDGAWSVQGSISGRKNNDTCKRVNISQYFIKSVQGSKASSKIDNNSTKYDNDNQSLGIHSVDCSQYLHPITNMYRNQSEPYDRVSRRVQYQSPSHIQNSSSPTKAQYLKIQSKKLIKMIEQERRQRKQNYKSRLQQRSKNISKLLQKKIQNKNKEKQRKQSLLEQNWKKISMFQGKNVANNNILEYK